MKIFTLEINILNRIPAGSRFLTCDFFKLRYLSCLPNQGYGSGSIFQIRSNPDPVWTSRYLSTFIDHSYDKLIFLLYWPLYWKIKVVGLTICESGFSWHWIWFFPMSYLDSDQLHPDPIFSHKRQNPNKKTLDKRNKTLLVNKISQYTKVDTVTGITIWIS